MDFSAFTATKKIVGFNGALIHVIF